MTIISFIMDAFSSPFLNSKITIPITKSTLSSSIPIQRLNISSSLNNPIVPPIIFNKIDNFINTIIDPPSKPSLDPNHVLSNNFAPVEELPPTECQITHGQLPPSLNGAYIRNGPNPHYFPTGPYHFFEGDGMLHSIKISNNRAVFCSRYVKTNRFKTENHIGSSVFPNFLSGFTSLLASLSRSALYRARVLAGHINPSDGYGVANTSLAFFGRRLYALYETDLPYIVRLTSNGDIETIGRHNFGEKTCKSMTAHPKTDFHTGETFAFCYNFVSPFLTYFRFDPDGTKHPDVPILSISRPCFIHDFAITSKFVIFGDGQVGLDPMEMILRGGFPIRSDPQKVPRLGVMARNATDGSQLRWFDAPGLNVIHTINAWNEDDGNTVVTVALNVLSVDRAFEAFEVVYNKVEKVKINLRTGLVRKHTMSEKNLDFGVINQAYVGKKNRYVYAGLQGDPPLRMSGVVKLDLWKEEGEECTMGCRMFGEGCYGSEPFFVPKYEEGVVEEDDGYVVTYVHDENSGITSFMVMDAKSPDLDVVAVVRLPGRVPYGFHGLFIKQKDLDRL